jgi:branched-chain amino acid transport system substrate-binding protein
MTVVRTRQLLVGVVAAAMVMSACGSDDGDGGDAAPTTAAEATTTTATGEETTTTEAPDTETTEAVNNGAAAEECGEPATGEPIVFGHINSTSGPINIPSAGFAVEVAFERYNECGGFNGQPLELVSRDGGLDPGLSAAAARELVEQENVVGFVGNNAFLDCLNGAYYVETGIANVGSSFDGTCFQNDNIFPTLPNFDRNLFPGVSWAIEQGATSFAYIALDIPGQRAQAEALTAYLESAGAELTSENFIPFGSAEVNTPVQAVSAAGVDAIVISVDELTFGAAAAAAVQQGIGPEDLPWIAPTGIYSPKALAALGPAGEGVYVVANYDVAENGNEFAAELREAIEANHPEAEVDGFAQLGWISAETLLAALDTIDGELTRESLLAAMTDLGEVDSVFLPNPITVNGPLPRNNVSQGLILQIADGGYTVISDGFIDYPAG